MFLSVYYIYTNLCTKDYAQKLEGNWQKNMIIVQNQVSANKTITKREEVYSHINVP